MKLLTCYTPSHERFVKTFDTVLDVEPDIELIVAKFDQECHTGVFADKGWRQTTARKFEFILEQLYKAEFEELLIFSDIDIQFFAPFTQYAEKVLNGHDIVFQNDYYGHACTGFFYMRNNPAVRALLEKALSIIPESRDDQEAMNKVLPTWSGSYALLPNQFFTFGSFYNHWNGELDFPLPEGMIMHHANWVKGIEKKEQLIKVVRNLYERNQFQ